MEMVGGECGVVRGSERNVECCASHARQRQCTVLKDSDFSMAAAWCVSATGRYLWILEKHVHINEQPLDEYKRDP